MPEQGCQIRYLRKKYLNYSYYAQFSAACQEFFPESLRKMPKYEKMSPKARFRRFKAPDGAY